MKLAHKLTIAFLIGALFVTLAILVQKPWTALGSSVVGNDYVATSTRNFNGTALTNFTVLKSDGGGALARVTITGVNTGVIRFWDATTTNANLRASSQASSTIFIGEIHASAATSTYDFDVQLQRGLIYELVTGNAPTSTIMYR